MYLQQLTLSGFRPFRDAMLELGPGMNIFYGNNGAGKTSLIESVYLLSHGRSFRTQSRKNIVKHASDTAAVFGVVDGLLGRIQLGLELSSAGGFRHQLYGKTGYTRKEVVKVFPTMLLNVDVLAMISGAAADRRDFLDRWAFHVEPDYLALWRNYNDALKQRNAVLKKTMSTAQDASPWTRSIVELGERMYVTRKRVALMLCEQLKADTSGLLDFIPPGESVEVLVKSGWHDNLSLQDALSESWTRDKALGYTTQGPHRGDLLVLTSKGEAGEVFSRGQTKRLVCGMFLSQSRVLQGLFGLSPVFLVDDLMSELDLDSAGRLFKALASFEGQVLATCLFESDVDMFSREQKDLKVFHVEQASTESSQVFHVEHSFKETV